MLYQKNAINLVTAKGEKRGGKKRKKSVRSESVSSSAVFMREGGVSALTDTGSSWVVRGLHIHHLCVQINLTSPRHCGHHSPLFFSTCRFFTAAQCACVNTHAHSNVYKLTLVPLQEGKLRNWVLLLGDSNDLIITSVLKHYKDLKEAKKNKGNTNTLIYGLKQTCLYLDTMYKKA